MTEATTHPLKRPASLSAERPTEQLKAAASKGKGKKAKDDEKAGKLRVCLYLTEEDDEKLRLMAIKQKISMSAVASKLIGKAPMPEFN